MKVTSEQFRAFQRFALNEACLVIEDDRSYLVETRLYPLLSVLGIAGFDDLLERLKFDSTARTLVLDALTTHETYFLRDKRPFDVLAAQVFPELIAQNRHRRALRIWSAACSSGQEPYSLAMLLLSSFPELLSWDVRVIASDISEEVLKRAKAGRYSQFEVQRGLPDGYLARFFDQSGLWWVVKPEVSRLVEFCQLNLGRGHRPEVSVDLILLRNVLIYFSADTKREVLRTAASALRPGGYLLLGTAENTSGCENAWVRREIGSVLFYQPSSSGSPTSIAV